MPTLCMVSDAHDSDSSNRSPNLSGLDWVPPSLEEMQARLPQYRFLALIGRGGMGAVFKALHVSLDRLVAVKVLPGDLLRHTEINFAERFQNEARTMAKLTHPAIVSVFDFGETTDGLLYFAMEFIDGQDLAKLIEQRGALPVDEALRFFLSVAEALAYAHSRGVIHRDIKPANVLIKANGEVKVADFGLAKLMGSPQGSGLTRTNIAMGTQEFAAPEQLKAGAMVDHRVDIYSLGVVLYQMLTGEIPRVMFKLPSLRRPELGARFDALICKALETDPADRFQSATEFRHELEVAAIAKAPSTNPPAHVKQGSQLGRLKLISVAVAAMVAIGAGGWLFLGHRHGHATLASSEKVGTTTQAGASSTLPHNEWIKLLDTPEAVARSGINGLELKDGWLTVTPERLYLVRLAGGKDKVRDMAFRATVRPPTNDWCIAAVLRAGAEPQYFLDVFHNRVTLRRVKQVASSEPAYTELDNVPLDLRQSTDGAFQLEVSIQGNLITVMADGAKVMEVRDEGAAGAGDIALVAPSESKGSGKIKDLAVRLLDEGAVATDTHGSTNVKHHETNVSIWTDWLGPNRKTLPSTWIVGPDGVTTEEEIVGHDVLPSATSDAAMRVTYISGRGHGMRLTMRERGTGESRECYLVQDEHDQIELCKVGPGMRTVILASKDIPADWNPSAERVMEFRAAGDLLTASLNGSLSLSVHDATLTAGPSAFSVVRGVLLKRVEIQSPDPVRRILPNGR